jgi:uncharacterized protein
MINLTKTEARQYLLKYQNLYTPRQLKSDQEIANFIHKVGCIQYDPLKTTARNADLVLQSRCKNYSGDTLYRLLYEKRKLLDGWDKNMSIWSVADWPYFERKRKYYKERYKERSRELGQLKKIIIQKIEQDEFVSSKDIGRNKKVEWSWGATTIARAALESMYHRGELVIHHKKGARKYYSLAEKMLPPSILNKPDPNKAPAQHQDWYIKRRIGSIGLMWDKPSHAWLGTELKSDDRSRSFKRLLDKDQIAEAKVAGIKETFYLLRKHLPILDEKQKSHQASLIAPLDNLIWDRKLIVELFDFDYKWEVYTPVKKRRYGYYVLPVLFRDKFVARCEPVISPQKELMIKNWWWEKDIAVNPDMRDALAACFGDFARSLDVEKISLSKNLSRSKFSFLKDCI